MAMDVLIASFGLINLFALGGVVLIGLPHGAFDGAIAACLGQADRPITLIRFITLYVALAGLVVGLWLLFPVAVLIGFLGISIIHFGLGDARAKSGWFPMFRPLPMAVLLLQASRRATGWRLMLFLVISSGVMPHRCGWQLISHL